MKRHQGGFVLIVSVIMLMVVTLLAVSAIKMSSVNLRTINNMQVRSEAMNAAQDVVDQVLSGNFTNDVAGAAKTYVVAVDAGKSYNVNVARPCIQAIIPIKNVDLNVDDAEDVKCLDTLSNPYSACATTIWHITATVNDGWFGANVSITQGTGLKMDNGTAAAYAADATFRCS